MNINAAVKLAASSVPQNSPSAVYRAVRIWGDGEHVHVYAGCDSYSVHLLSESKMRLAEVAVEAKSLHKVLLACGDNDFSMDMSGQHLRIICGQFKAKIPTVPLAELPPMFDPPAESQTLPDLQLNLMSPVVSSANRFPYVHVGSRCVAATDSRRFHVLLVDTNCEAHISHDVLRQLASLKPSRYARSASRTFFISEDGSWISCTHREDTMGDSVLAILDKSEELPVRASATCQMGPLSDAVTAILSACSSQDVAVKVEIVGAGVHISRHKDLDDVEVMEPAEVTGGGVIFLHGRYLGDALRGDGDVRLSMRGEDVLVVRHGMFACVLARCSP